MSVLLFASISIILAVSRQESKVAPINPLSFVPLVRDRSSLTCWLRYSYQGVDRQSKKRHALHVTSPERSKTGSRPSHKLATHGCKTNSSPETANQICQRDGYMPRKSSIPERTMYHSGSLIKACILPLPVDHFRHSFARQVMN